MGTMSKALRPLLREGLVTRGTARAVRSMCQTRPAPGLPSKRRPIYSKRLRQNAHAWPRNRPAAFADIFVPSMGRQIPDDGAERWRRRSLAGTIVRTRFAIRLTRRRWAVEPL